MWWGVWYPHPEFKKSERRTLEAEKVVFYPAEPGSAGWQQGRARDKLWKRNF